MATHSERRTATHGAYTLKQFLRAISCGFFLLLAALQPAFAESDEEEDATFSVGDTQTADPATQYSALRSEGRYEVTANFRSFDREALSIRFDLDAAASRASQHEFGVSGDELDALERQCLSSSTCDQREFDRWTTRYYREHGLKMKPVAGQGHKLYVDVAQVVRRNRTRVKPVAAALRKLADERGYDQSWTLNAAVAMVQTGLVYRQPKAAENGRRILGFYPPPLALERGYGDCDTKSALLAAILQNLTETPIVGVHVPKHYLLGIASEPREGQASIIYQGQTYVLVEAAGPGQRRPGEVAKATRAALVQQQGIRVDPMF